MILIIRFGPLIDKKLTKTCGILCSFKHPRMYGFPVLLHCLLVNI